MSEAVYVRDANEQRLTAGAAVSHAEIWQMPTGEAGYLDQTTRGAGASSGGKARFLTNGKVTVTKTASTDTYELALDWQRAHYSEQ